MHRVVVTGMGVVCPIGNDIKSFKNGLINGESGIGQITQFDTTDYNVKIAGECSIDLNNFFDSKELKRMDRFTALSLIAAEQAINESNITSNLDQNNKIGVIFGSGIGGISTFETQHSNLLRNPRRVSPFFIPSMISDIAAGHISIKYGFKGPNFSIVSACATANHSIGESFKKIKHGDASAIITGGSDATITPMAIAGFSNMKALSKSNKEDASRPFDQHRDGFVMGEGSGVLVLESLENAQKRDAKIIAEIVGYGSSADAYHLTSPSINGDGAKEAMNEAISEAKISTGNIDYINAHGTSTPYNDKIETKAIKDLFGDDANNLSISSTKSMTGHLLGAAGAIESIASIIAINNNFIPPTINYETPDPECDLDYTPNKSITKEVNYCISNNFGFGGHNAVLAFKKYIN